MSEATWNVSTERDGHVGRIRFANPPLNFASVGLLAKLADTIGEMDADPEIRCILLTSDGKNFCAGADLKDGDAGAAGDQGVAAIGAFYEQAGRLFDRRKPMVAAVQGAAIGAGLGLAMSADFRVVSPASRLSANFVRLGFHPGFALTHTLPRAIGQQKALWMMLSAERVKGEQAVAWGLADRLSTDADLIDDARIMAQEIAANAPLSLVDIRATMTGTIASDARAALAFELSRQAILRDTEDYAEGVASTFERRDARFVGR